MGTLPKLGCNKDVVRSTKTCKISRTVQDRTKVTITHYRFVPTSMTLDDLERLKRHSCRNKRNLWAHQKNFNIDRPILSAAKCRPMIVVSKNVRYKLMRIIRGSSSGRGRQIQYMLPYTCVLQPALDVYTLQYVLWTCNLWLWQSTVTE